jgi:hypothetical protein
MVSRFILFVIEIINQLKSINKEALDEIAVFLEKNQNIYI